MFKKKQLILILLGLVLIIASLSYFVYTNKKGADIVAKPAALHLSYDDVMISNPAGQAESGYAIPKNVINNDFTIRIALKVGEYDWANWNILSIEGNGNDTCTRIDSAGKQITFPGWRKRIQFRFDSSPISHLNLHNMSCGQTDGGSASSDPSKIASLGERSDGGTRAQEVYEDYFIVYKKPIKPTTTTTGEDGYFRIYRSLDENGSVIPQGMDYVKINDTQEKYLNYVIDKNIDYDWQGNDTAFRIVVGDRSNKTAGDVTTGFVRGQNLKVTELAMWTRALDQNNMEKKGTYLAKYYGAHQPNEYDRYQSEAINAIAQKALSSLDGSYRDSLYFHFGGTDKGLSSDKWLNDAPLAPSNIDLSFSGASSLTSDVPNWINSNYPESSRTPPKLSPLNSISISTRTISSTKMQIKISNIPQGTALENCFELPLKRKLYISTSQSDYKYTSIKKEFIKNDASEVTISDLDSSVQNYYVTIEWIDKLENITKISKNVRSGTVQASVTNMQSIHLTDSPNNKIARTETAYKLPVNKPITFRLLFKLNTIPMIESYDDKPVYLFQVYDSLHGKDGYQVMNVSATKVGARTVMKFRICDGDKFLDFVLDGENGTVTKDVWEEFWFSFTRPTSTSEGSLYVYRYKRDTNEVLTVYNNVTPIPKVTSWFSDWNFKKWETRIFLGSVNNKDDKVIIGADFYINQASWWTKALSAQQIGTIAGYNIEDLPPDLKYSDSLFWNLTPLVTGSKISGVSGTSKAVYNLQLNCMQDKNELKTNDCVPVSDTPSFLVRKASNIKSVGGGTNDL